MVRPRSLTARLVATTVLLVVGVTVLVGALSALAVRSYLLSQLDDQVTASLQRAQRAPSFGDGPGPDGLDDRRGQGVGTLTAVWIPDRDVAVGDVIVEGQDGRTSRSPLSEDDLEALDEVSADDGPHTVRLDDFGGYRVVVVETSAGKLAAGLPTRDVDAAVATLLGWQGVLTVLGAVAALGGALVLVRRQLRPLREVAGTANAVARLPLARGDIELAERVPADLADESTEVGQVGSALNTLLDHVESSLEARQRSEEQVRQFVADASHELRTPLATIAGYSELARSRPDDEEALRRALEKVEDESHRMTALVEDLLLLARLDAGRPLARQPVDLTRMLLEAVADARVIAPDHVWRLTLPDEPIEVLGDEQRLHQVVTNLLTNARKHTPAGTTVTVAADPSGFTVHDDGPGFSPDLAEHAFERFTRGDRARTREGGVGLGLALVAAIVEAHGGGVTLDSRPGDTTFTVRLPAEGAQEGPPGEIDR
ncbi:sensor histidine kinase [Aeromicrobium duanguangcaii]|uniref:histidine kinase n=1 Tax=Aeromicrobium duanguangcaii TaxID=2968086 RepID=A0ABY5KGU3_9ACTN|nr:HAMP domain-containing sensor histidine kinase [Aeromicrobium duanguangcaii]MCD9153346.1 HAMP domain-containing histidine kinase [Aeromicrobium duanguangcaii]UUI69560.1 HAMP domain-containing histidine kinase [Aeromicrobium duanguangcaii]